MKKIIAMNFFKCSMLTLLSLIFFVASTNAQNVGKISGSIIVKNEKTGDGATVSLLRAKDSTTVRLSAANKEGVFIFDKVGDGKYIIAVTSVGNQKNYSNVIEISPQQQTIQLSAIELIPARKNLAAVTVTATRPLVEQRIDRTIVNVDASITNLGASALEVLEKSPGITVDREGNISLKGKEGVLVLVDGRPTHLSGVDLANLLRNMASSQMDQIEIMTNPPARYDAAGNAGIINIKTKKTTNSGYNGSANVNYIQGQCPKTNEGINFNYRTKKINLFTNLSHNYRKGFETLTIQRNIRNGNTKELENYFDQESNKIVKGNSYNAKVGFDYFANTNTSFGIILNRTLSASDITNRNTTNILTPGRDIESITKATVDNDNEFRSFNTNLNFRTVFSLKRELTADIDFVTHSSANEQFMVNSYPVSPDAAKKADTLQGRLPQNINVYSGRIDYLHPLKNNARFEAGLKSSIVWWYMTLIAVIILFTKKT